VSTTNGARLISRAIHLNDRAKASSSFHAARVCTTPTELPAPRRCRTCQQRVRMCQELCTGRAWQCVNCSKTRLTPLVRYDTHASETCRDIAQCRVREERSRRAHSMCIFSVRILKKTEKNTNLFIYFFLSNIPLALITPHTSFSKPL